MELQFHRKEFEYEVRSQLKIFDRAITDVDAASVTALDLSEFDFSIEDYETLCCFNNLNSLDINIGNTTSDFWSSFPKMRDLCVVCWEVLFDFESLKVMTDLESLTVSGGDISDISYLNLDAIVDLQKLTYLELHEFGTVDLRPLKRMKQLRRLALRYSDKINNIDTLASMNFLEELELDGLYVESLDFLDALPDTLNITMCGNHVSGGVDVGKWKRFAKRDICEISVGNQQFKYIDLSALD